MANFTKNTFSQTYFDDWDKNNNYHRVLFNSGRALQARELTQMQSIINGEMRRLGNNIYKEGAAVSAGEITVNATYQFVKITTSIENVVVGEEIEQQSAPSGVKAIVLEKDSVNNILYVRYVSDGTATIGTESVRFSQGGTLLSPNAGSLTITNAGAGADVGSACKVTIGEGDFYTMGHFVHAREQSIILGPVPRNPANAVLGFKVNQSVTTVNSDSDGYGGAIGSQLYDNWGGTSNTSAPGADRYTIRLDIIEESAVTSDDTFLFICRIENGKLTEQVQEIDAYNKINDLLAARTKEESGNYLVAPFTAHYEDDNNADSDLTMVLSAGTAYVNGYRIDKQVPTKIRVPRPDATETINNGGIGIAHGQYVNVTMPTGLSSGQFPLISANSSTVLEVDLRSAAGYGGSTIGSATVTDITKVGGGVFKLHLTRIIMTGANKFSAVRSIGSSTAIVADVELTGSLCVLQGGANTSYLYPYPYARPALATATDISYTYTTTTASQATTAGGVFDSTSGAAANDLNATRSEIYVNPESWIVYQDGIGIVQGVTPVIAANGLSYTISGLTGSTNTSVCLKIKRSAPVRRTKQLLTKTAIAYTISAGGITFNETDIAQVSLVSQSGVDITSDFTLYNGQQDTFYEKGRLILNAGIAHTGSIDVTYTHYDHSDGDFFDFSSFSNIDYEDLPNHRMTSGEIRSLRDYIDFRPYYDGSSMSSTTDAAKPPANGTSVEFDAKFYLGRADKILVTEDGEVKVLMGQQAREPQFKQTPDNSMELYKVVMNPYTINPDDLSMYPLEHKVYTMPDIAELDRRLSLLEELSTLTGIELATKLDTDLDSDGLERPESGYIVDTLDDQGVADTNLIDYCASLDPESKLVRPCFDEENLRLIYQPDDGAVFGGASYQNTSKNVTQSGDNVYLNYTTAEWQKQDRASTSVAINKTNEVDNIGKMILSPSSDEWKGTYWDTSPVLAGKRRLDNRSQTLWNNWEWGWLGRSVEDQVQPYSRPNPLSTTPSGQNFAFSGCESTVDLSSGSTSRATNLTTNGSVRRVVSSDTIRQRVGNRVIDMALVPWIRSRKIFFKAEGMRPNTTYNAFFDGINVTAWCNGNDTFTRYAATTDDVGNQYENLSGHPSVNAITSNSEGKIEGSFIIPNQRPVMTGVANRALRRSQASSGLRFRAGVREFKLVDNTSGDITNAGSHSRSYYAVVGAINNARNHVLSNRYLEPSWSVLSPMSGPSDRGQRPGGVHAKSVDQTLDALSSTDIKLLSPHLSGSYGPDTSGLEGSIGNIDISRILKDYVDVDINYFGSDATTVREIGESSTPFAQSFHVDNAHGVVLSSVDLFFKSRPSTSIPIIMEIRPMENGRPSLSESVPGSTVVVARASVAIPSTETMTVIKATPTVFTFDEPVYLSPWQEYAICLKTQSSDYEIYISKTGEFELGTDKQVTTSPLVGSLFYSRNSTSTVQNEADLMFKLNRCVFDTNGSLVLRNSVAPSKLLLNNPIRTNGTSTIYVTHPCHGLHVGETATISGAIDTGGISAANINGSRTVTGIDGKGYQVVAGASASSTTKGGGANVLSARNIHFEVFNPYIESVLPIGTTSETFARYTQGRSLSDPLTTKFVKDVNYTKVQSKQNLAFNDYPRMIAMRSEEIDANGTATNNGTIAGSSTFSLDVKIDLKSISDYVSPIVDLQRCSAILVQSCVDDDSITPPIYNVAETEPDGGSALSKHITAPITVNEDAVGLSIKFDTQLPLQGSLDTYYRVATGGEDLLSKNWVQYNALTEIPKSSNPNNFVPVTLLPGGVAGNLAGFNQAQVKFVMKSQNSASVPALRDISIKLLAV